MQVDVLTETIINRPQNVVAEFATAPENATKWYTKIKKAEWKTPKPIQKGSKVAFEAHFLGKVLIYTYEITEFVPNEKLVMRTEEGPFPMETTYSWQPVGPGSTKMTLRNRGRPAGFSAFMTPIMKLAMRSANKKDLALLKQVLEKTS